MKIFFNTIFTKLLNIYYNSNTVPSGYMNKNIRFTITLLISLIIFFFTRLWFNEIIDYIYYILINSNLFTFLSFLFLVSILSLFIVFYLFYIQLNLILKCYYLIQVIYKTYIQRIIPNNIIIQFYLLKNILLAFLSLFVLYKLYLLCSIHEFTLVIYLSALLFTFLTAFTISYIVSDTIISIDFSKKPTYNNIILFIICIMTLFYSYLLILSLAHLSVFKLLNISNLSERMKPLYMSDPSLDSNILPDSPIYNKGKSKLLSSLEDEEILKDFDLRDNLNQNLKEGSFKIKDTISLMNSNGSRNSLFNQSLYSEDSDFVRKIVEVSNKIDLDNEANNFFYNYSNGSDTHFDLVISKGHRFMNISPISESWSALNMKLLDSYENKIALIKTKLLQHYMDSNTKQDPTLFGKASLRYGFRNLDGKELSLKKLINIVQHNPKLPFASRGKYNSLFYLELDHQSLKELVSAFKHYNALSFTPTTLVPQLLEFLTIQHSSVEKYLLYPGNIEEYNKFSNLLELLLQQNSNFVKKNHLLNDIANTTLTNMTVTVPVNFSFRIWNSNEWVNHYVHDLNHFDLKILYDLGEVRKLSTIFDTHGKNHIWCMNLQEFRNLSKNSIINWILVRNNDEFEQVIFEKLKINISNVQYFWDKIQPNFYGNQFCFYLTLKDYIEYIQKDLPQVWEEIISEINNPNYKYDNVFYNSIKHYKDNNLENTFDNKSLLRKFSPRKLIGNKKLTFGSTEEKLTFYHQMYRNSVERHLGIKD